MALFTITHNIDVADESAANEIRDLMAALANEGSETPVVISSGTTQVTQQFTLLGVNTKTSEPFQKDVQAVDATDAASQVSNNEVVAAIVNDDNQPVALPDQAAVS